MIAYLRTLWLLYRRSVRVQPVREAMAVAGIAAGVALLFAVQVAHRSITGSLEQVTRGVAGRATVELAARGPEGFQQRIAEEAERLPGVARAAQIVEQPIVVHGPHGRRPLLLVGATEQVTSLGGEVSSAFEEAANRSRGGILLLSEATADAVGAREGKQVAVSIAGQEHHLAVAAIVPGTRLGPAAQAPVAATALPVAQLLAQRPGRVNRVLFEPRPGREEALLGELRASFGARLDARPVSTEARLLGNAAGAEKQVTLLFSAISLVAGIVLAYNALLLASDERRRFMVQLIRTGTPESMIFASLAFDATVLGVLGCVLGLAAGEIVSLLAYQSVPGYIAAAFPIGGQRVVDAMTVLSALGAGIVAAFAAAALPALRILRSSAQAEPEAVGRALSFTHRRQTPDMAVFALGVVLVVLSILTAAVLPSGTVVSLMALAAGLVLCMPLATRYLLGVARRATRRARDPAALLSVAELRKRSTRAVALLATGTIAAFLTVLIGGSVSDVKHAVSQGATDLLSSAQIWIKPGGAENVYTTQPFQQADAQQRLERVPGVASVQVWQDSFLDLSKRRVWVVGVPTQTTQQLAPSQLLQGSLSRADRLLRKGGWAALSKPIAQELHVRIGQEFTLPTPTGMARLRLAATVANYGWLPGSVVMNESEHARLWGSTAATQLAVRLTPDTTLVSAKNGLERALPKGAALSVHTQSERRSEVNAVLGSTLSRLNDTTIIVLVVAVVSVLALMLSAVAERRERLNSLIAVGWDFRQLTRLVFYETGVALLTGCLMGMAAGLVGQYLIDSWLSDTTGSPVHYSPAWQPGLRTFAIATGISVLASVLAAIQIVDMQPRTAFSAD
jgi:putative ABC transport system permease protein